jgi:hypothetical protein
MFGFASGRIQKELIREVQDLKRRVAGLEMRGSVTVYEETAGDSVFGGHGGSIQLSYWDYIYRIMDHLGVRMTFKKGIPTTGVLHKMKD